MKLSSSSCPEMYSIEGRFKAGNPLRPLFNRCGITKRRCIYTQTSKVREHIKSELIKNCPLRRR